MSRGRCSRRPRPSSRLPSLRRLRMKSFLMRDSGLSSMSAASVRAVAAAPAAVAAPAAAVAAAAVPAVALAALTRGGLQLALLAAGLLGVGLLLLVERRVEALHQGLALELDDLAVALDGHVERLLEL